MSSQPPPFRVKAVYDYTSTHDEDLSFAAGDIITVTEEEDDDWYVGNYVDASGTKQDGLFPRNFVERFEPEAPPRPARNRAKKDNEETPGTGTSPTAVAAPDVPAVEAGTTSVIASTAPAKEPALATAPTPAPVSLPPRTQPAEIQEPPVAPKPETAKPAPAVTEKAPPPVAQKPAGSSFKDRIAAFNKPSAPPVAPKPQGPHTGGALGFIKKPFVAPPPSRSAYVPPPTRQDAPQKIYRREEDPEIAERQRQEQEAAEAAGLAAGSSKAEDADEAPKATSLKDRIALLQKQQQEQALRRAEGGGKDQTKKASKPQTDADEDQGEVVGSPDISRSSTEAPRDVTRPPTTGRRPSKQAVPTDTTSILSGNEADESAGGDTAEDVGEDESTEVESDEVPRSSAAPPIALTRTSTTISRRSAVQKDEQEPEIPHDVEAEGVPASEDEEEEEEEDIDPEVRRKQELRERMAKMSGGMGMPGMFGGMGMPMPGSTPKAPRTAKSSERKSTKDSQESARSPPPTARVPAVPIPGLPPRVMSPQSEDLPLVTKEPEPEQSSLRQRAPDEVADVEDVEPVSAPPPPIPKDRGLPERGPPPPVPSDRPVPAEARAIPPPPPPARPADPVKQELEAEEELLEDGKPLPLPPRTVLASSGAPTPPGRPEGPRQQPSHSAKRSSAVLPASIPTSPPLGDDKRSSRAPPPIPGTTDVRAPPPPPARKPSEDDSDEDGGDGESEYEGDYDTDIGSAVPHKDALKAHQKAPSADEEEIRSPVQPPIPAGAVPLHGTTARAPPPPPPNAPAARASVDAPRAVPPPPPPPARSPAADDDYDPFRYSGIPAGAQNIKLDDTQPQQESDPSLYARSPPAPSRAGPPPALPQSPPPVHNVPPPLPPHHQILPESAALPIRQSNDVHRASADLPRQSLNATRRSVDLPRGSGELGPLARAIDLGEPSLWWTQANKPPPALQNRSDVLLEFEESSTSKRGGRTTISRDVYVLYQDYSSSTISARFDTKEPEDASLEQTHQGPPSKPSQDQLEAFSEQFAKTVVSSTHALANTTVEDGTPIALVRKALASVPAALPPIGSRTFGIPIYANLGNASVSQSDEIRPGDIVSFRNAKFSGKHGAMHAKYSMDVGEPEHVAVVSEWDGTKKKIRAWEQGRENKKVKVESFKLGDLRSGEVKVWRIAPRSFVGWEGES